MPASVQRHPGIASQAERVFAQRFGRPCLSVAMAPGRVNLIGEHVDYSGGYVLPMAIDRYTAVAIAPASSKDTIRVGSGLAGESITVRVDSGREGLRQQPKWAQYVLGVVQLMLEAGDQVTGFDAWIESDVPLGAGLSSSAALEVATVKAVDALHGRSREPMQTARLCMRAEHEFAGVPCGIMDMATSAAAKAGCVLLLDCRSQRIEHVPFADEAVSVLIANTNVSHSLADGAYAQRRADCERAAAALGLTSLREATLTQIESARPRLDDAAYRRACHVASEIERTVEAGALLAKGQWQSFGQKMYDSHASLRDLFEVSCDELDQMVDLGRSIGIDGGVYGSRMTGGGFGGCTVSLVRTDQADAIAQTLSQQYQQRTGIEPSLFVSRPARGAYVSQKPTIQD